VRRPFRNPNARNSRAGDVGFATCFQQAECKLVDPSVEFRKLQYSNAFPSVTHRPNESGKFIVRRNYQGVYSSTLVPFSTSAAISSCSTPFLKSDRYSPLQPFQFHHMLRSDNFRAGSCVMWAYKVFCILVMIAYRGPRPVLRNI